MRRLRYTHLDVFTAEPFGGNQLAVFFDAGALDSAEMQSLAKEMNFSESTFILPPEGHGALCRVRIFTPGGELPFAGHPVIGTAVALARAGRITASSPDATLELGVGPLGVTVVFEEGEPRRAWMDQPLPAFGAWGGDRAALLDALGLEAASVRDDLPIERGSAGVPFIYIPLRDLAALGRARPARDLRRWRGRTRIQASTSSFRRSHQESRVMLAPACSRRGWASWKTRRLAPPPGRSASICGGIVWLSRIARARRGSRSPRALKWGGAA